MRPRLAAYIAILWGLLAGTGSASGQTGTLSGTITDAETGMPAAGAEVEILGGGASPALADESGQFTISVPAGSYAVVISSLGYRDHREDGVSIRAGATTTLDVVIVSQALELDPIVVTASRQEEKNTTAPATTYVVGEIEVAERPVVTPTDYVRTAPGVDIISSGTQSTNVVIRGFNNLFSGALHTLTDHRLAGVPSLRVNLLHFIPAVNDDIERIEVVLGPGSALYGPQTANGVLHLITKSPLTSQGTTVTLGAGPRKDVFQGSFRTAHRVSDNLAFKVSGHSVAGNEWIFVDPEEQAARAAAYADPDAFMAQLLARGLSQAQAAQALVNVGARDYTFSRQSVDARVDWQLAEDGRLTFNYGLTNSGGLEMTGLGAGQTEDWKYEFFQTRLNKGRLFAQWYLNSSDAGNNSFLLRDGAPIVDTSRLFVGQLQHGAAFGGGKYDFTYGLDVFWTDPQTAGTINGRNELDDQISEFGAYIQNKTELTDRWDLVLAGRVDSHSALESRVFSPRAALVYEVAESHRLRFTYNRAFSTPSTSNLFLDIYGGPAGELGTLGYGVRAQGSYEGFTFTNPDGSLVGMRSPFNPAANGGPGQLIPADAATLWRLGAGVLQQAGVLDAATAALLAGVAPGANGAVGINLLDPNTQALSPLASHSVPNVDRIKEATTSTFEVGYQGLIDNKVLLAADVWYSEKADFVSPLVVTTPLLLLDGPSMVAYMVPLITEELLRASGGLIDVATAQATATGLAGQLADGGDGPGGTPGLAELPLGVVSGPQVDPSGSNLLLTYVNAGDIGLWGADFSIKAFLTDEWVLAATGSWVSDDYFDLSEIENGIAPIALNAPDLKGTLSIGYRNVRRGLNLETRLRANSVFPAESAGYAGTRCETGPRGLLFETDCVGRYALVDVTGGYRVPNTRATLQVTVSNLFDERYRSFVGVPEIGRFLMAQVKYELF